MIRVVDLPLPPVNKKEVLRYLSAKHTSAETDALIASATELALPHIKTRCVFRYFDISVEGDLCDLGFCAVKSHSLGINLKGCKKIALVCATVGLEIDRLVKRYSLVRPSLSHAISAVGSERIEALMDNFSEFLKQNFTVVRPRFSAGYGDLDLSVQEKIFSALHPEQSLGLTLNESLIMSPAKSVSAIIGIE